MIYFFESARDKYEFARILWKTITTWIRHWDTPKIHHMYYNIVHSLACSTAFAFFGAFGDDICAIFSKETVFAMIQQAESLEQHSPGHRPGKQIPWTGQAESLQQTDIF